MRKILGVVSAALLIAGLGASASAAPAPAPKVPIGAPAASPPLLTNAQRDARLAALPASAQEAMAKAAAEFKGVTPPTMVPDPLVSGHTPYGGDTYSALRTDGWFNGCATALATRSAAGAQYVYTAGHCMMNAAGTEFLVSSAFGKFWSPYTSCTNCRPADLGNVGHGGTEFNTKGDHSFIRANLAWGGTGLYSEVSTWDSRGAVRAEGVSDPAVGMAASVSAGVSRKLLRGTVGWINQSTTMQGHPTLVGNLGILRITKTLSSCPQPGDSGGTIIDSNHWVLGTLSAASADATYCYAYFDQAGTTMTRIGQWPAPYPPA